MSQIVRTNKGDVQSKANGSTLTLASIAITEDSSVVVFLIHDPVGVTSVKWNAIDLTKLKEETFTSNIQGSIWALHDCAAATANIEVVFAANIDAKTMAAVQLRGRVLTAGGNAVLAHDVSASAQGTGTAPNSGATAALAQGGELALGVLGWEAVLLGGGTGTFTWSGQAEGTTGGADDTNIWAADYYFDPGEVTTAITLGNTGASPSSDWVALVSVFKETGDEIQDAQQYRTFAYTQDQVEVAQQYRTFAYTQDEVQVAQQYRTFWYAIEPTSQISVSEIVRQIEYLELADLLPQTCSLIPRVRIRRLDDLIQVMELTGYEFLRYTKIWQGIGEFELLINGQSEKALEMIEKGVVGNIGSPSSINNFILEVSYDGVSDFAGIIDFPSVEWMDDGTEMLRLVGPDLKRWMADRIIVPPTGLEHDSYADLQETIIKSMIDRHLVNPIATDALGFNDAQRAIDYLIISTDLLRGSATTFEGRGQSLFSAVSEVANFANEFGFDFYIQNDQVIFDLFDGEDRSDYVVFDIALGNVSNFKSEWDGMNFASHALLAGQGEGVARTMRTAQTSPQTYTGPRRREVFQDARDLNTAAKLLDRGTAVIRDRSRILRLSAEKIQSLGPCYKDDFNLGDIVTVRNSKYNVSQSVKIYEVQVIHQAQRAPQVLLTWNTPRAPSALKLIRDDIAPGSSRT